MSVRQISDTVQRIAPGVDIPRPFRSILFMTPLAIFYVPFLIVPAVLLGAMSLFAGSTFQNLEFVGLANYQFLFEQGVIWMALQNSIIYTIGHTVLGVGGGLLVAIAIMNSYKIVQRHLRFLYMFPLAMMGVAVGFIWRYMYNTRSGAIPALVKSITGNPDAFVNILGNPELALSAIILVGGWRGLGFYTVIWVIALLNVDDRYYEAAKIDGVSSWATFRYITLPLTKSIGVFLVLHSMIGSMKMFAYFWVMTEGGPGRATEVLITYMYKLGFKQGALGRAAAVGVFLFLTVLVMTVAIERVVGLEPDYERGV